MARPRSELVVDVAALRQRGVDRHTVSAPLGADWLRSALSSTDASVGQPGAVALEIGIEGTGSLLVRGRLDASFEVPCARCLAPASVDGGVDLCVSYVVGARAPDLGEEVTLAAEDLERLVYDGETVDLRPMLAEQVALAYPMRALCSRGEQCRGLCTGCGADLNGQGDPAMCAACGLALSGRPAGGAAQTEAETPWKAALSKLRSS